MSLPPDMKHPANINAKKGLSMKIWCRRAPANEVCAIVAWVSERVFSRDKYNLTTWFRARANSCQNRYIGVSVLIVQGHVNRWVHPIPTISLTVLTCLTEMNQGLMRVRLGSNIMMIGVENNSTHLDKNIIDVRVSPRMLWTNEVSDLKGGSSPFVKLKAAVGGRDAELIGNP